jgi:hypothetical protein
MDELVGVCQTDHNRKQNKWGRPIHIYCKLGFAAVMVTLLAGCGTNSPLSLFRGGSAPFEGVASGPCHDNPRSCIHKGRYESGERQYAEQEAERLNQLALERLRRNNVTR